MQQRLKPSSSTEPQVSFGTRLFGHFEDMSFFYIAFSVTGCFLVLLICVLIMLFKSRKKAKRPQDLFLFDLHDDTSTCKSAPISRRSSPTREKRNSCPQAYGSLEDDIRARPLDYDAMPRFETEQIQPKFNVFDDASTSSLPIHTSCTASRKVQIPPIRVASEGSLYHGLPPLEPSRQGRIWFTALHNIDAHQLVVTLIKLKELQGRSEDEATRDPFVRVLLLPDEHTYHTSRIHKKTLDPVFNEVFTFDMESKDIKMQRLRFSVYDVDRRRIRHTLGHVVISLEDLNLNSPETVWRDLEQGIHTSPSIGELNIALSYLPHMERMKVIILRARNIRRPSDPDNGFYVRLQFHYGTKLTKTKTSLTQLGGTEINFNESFSFSTSNKNIDNFNFNVALMRTLRSSLSHDVEIGHVSLGSFMYARGEGLLHWQEMLAKTRNIATKWHQLSMPTV